MPDAASGPRLKERDWNGPAERPAGPLCIQDAPPPTLDPYGRKNTASSWSWRLSVLEK